MIDSVVFLCFACIAMAWGDGALIATVVRSNDTSSLHPQALGDGAKVLLLLGPGTHRNGPRFTLRHITARRVPASRLECAALGQYGWRFFSCGALAIDQCLLTVNMTAFLVRRTARGNAGYGGDRPTTLSVVFEVFVCFSDQKAAWGMCLSSTAFYYSGWGFLRHGLEKERERMGFVVLFFSARQGCG